MTTLHVDRQELSRLHAPWEEPNRHRQAGNIAAGRRPSHLAVPNALRRAVGTWREAGYEGASETSRVLLTHWFGGEHLIGEREFRYYFCQQEAIETLIYLYEVAQIRSVSGLIAKYDYSLNAELVAAGVPRTDNAWPKYAFKLATGTGKTKCMSLAIVWSYFHARREPNSELTTRFLVIAPGLTVTERLLEDFGDGEIFDNDPLIPPAWKKDWHLNVIHQNEPGGAGNGVLYLTNIQKLYPKQQEKANQYYTFMGPAVTPTSSIDIGAALRERIASESRLMVLNDEAHHIWHPDLAWSQAIQFFHQEAENRHRSGLVAQLDFSATPRDRSGTPLKHIVCDTPLGEAVDAGIVKVPVIGSAALQQNSSDNAAEKYRAHLELGYKRWKASFFEWEKVGKKVLLFVMCENTQAADQITKLLNTDPHFEKLNGKTLNLHTNLKGKINKHGEFIENEKQMSNADLKALRKLSRELDSNQNPYACIVSVLMLREGWDVKNVTVIVPLRPFTADSKILPEQTLGRGLRRITHPDTTEVAETVVVIEHPAFNTLYQEALGIEGVTPIIQEPTTIKSTVVSIYPEQIPALDIEIPCISDAHWLNLVALDAINRRDVEGRCAELPKLSLANPQTAEYIGRHLITNQLVEWMPFHLPLLENGWTAISYFVKQLERVCCLPPILHPIIAPLLAQFLTEMLFEEKVTLTDARLIQRLSDDDVVQRIHAVFAPLILERLTETRKRRAFETAPMRLSTWQPYPFTASERNPVVTANKTMFNLVPCHRHFEAEFTRWLDAATDVKAFAKNAGPEALRIDYLTEKGRIARYIPDFVVCDSRGAHFLIETKGMPDENAGQKAIAGRSWCRAASESAVPWHYLFVHQNEWRFFSGQSLHGLRQFLQQTDG